MGSKGGVERRQLVERQLVIEREVSAKRSHGLARGLAVLGLSVALLGVVLIVALGKVGWFWPSFGLAVLALLAREWVP
jgi:hypothetical protein